MKLLLKRIARKPNYTIGKLYVDGAYFADTLEDTDRGLKLNMPLSQIVSTKIKDRTAIPTGTYKVNMNIISPKFSKKYFYKKYACEGRLPRIMEVPGFEGVLMHVGNTANDSSGCILVGKNKLVGMLLDSKDTFIQLYKKLLTANNNIVITIE